MSCLRGDHPSSLGLGPPKYQNWPTIYAIYHHQCAPVLCHAGSPLNRSVLRRGAIPLLYVPNQNSSSFVILAPLFVFIERVICQARLGCKFSFSSKGACHEVCQRRDQQNREAVGGGKISPSLPLLKCCWGKQPSERNKRKCMFA